MRWKELRFENNVSGLPDLPVQRSLTLIAKVIQSLANLNATAQKEEFMRGVKSFLEEKLPEMLDYIIVVSTPGPEEYSQPSSEAHVRSRAVRALHDRKLSMPDLQRELIPHEQHFLDIPRHLAIVTSTIVRHSRNVDPEDPEIADLYNRCRDVERHALYYVSRHPVLRGGGGFVACPPASSDPSISLQNNFGSIEEPQPLFLTHSRTSSFSRPQTAPTGAMSDPALHTLTGSRHSQEYPLGASAEPWAETSEDSWRMTRRQASHTRSVSSDSIPNLRGAPGGTNVHVEAVRPRNAGKKWFLPNIWNRK